MNDKDMIKNNKKATANKNKKVRDWIKNHGCASFDFKNKDIILHDGGLFAIETKTVQRHKVIGTKPLPNGGGQIMFSKKKFPIKEHYAVFWFEEVDDTISFFEDMKLLLNSLGYRTSRAIKSKGGK